MIEHILDISMNCKHCKAEWTPPANVSLTSCPFCQKPLIEVLDIGDNAKPDIVLCQVTERFGIDILADRRLSAILKDLMPYIDRKYHRIFDQAVADGIGKKLIELENEDVSLRTVKIHTIKSYFCSNNGFDHTADYVVDCFLFSLGLIDKAEEKEYAIDVNAANIIHSQLEKAMKDDCLSIDETELLFSFGVQLNLTETAIATIINDAIKQKGLQPAKVLEQSIKSPKELLCSCDWLYKKQLTFQDGSIYVGESKNGKANGKGKYTWANGDVYEGEYKDDKKNGKGKFTYANGRVREEEWKEGRNLY